MAVTFNNDTTGRTATLNADLPENIVLDAELSGRAKPATTEEKAADAKALAELVTSIELYGQRTPALCRKNEQGLPVLVYGHRRLRAIQIINEKRRKTGESLIQLEFTYEKLTPEQAFIAAIQENRVRKDATPMDDAHNIAIWAGPRFKKTFAQIAEIYSPEARTPDAKAAALKWVKDRAAMLELTEEAQQSVRKGELKVTSAVHLARLSPEKQKEVIAAATESSKVKGKIRIKVANVLAAKGKGTTAEKAKAQLQAQKDKKAGKKPSAPAPAPVKVSSTVYQAAETLARAVEAALSRNETKDKNLIAALHAYRQLVPFKKAASEAAA